MSERVLKSCRVVERRTDAGPILYVVQELWHPSKGWAASLTTHDRKAAFTKMHGVIEGLDGSTGERVLASWTQNSYHLPHLASIENERDD